MYQLGGQIIVKSVLKDLTFIYGSYLTIETRSIKLSSLIRPNKMNISQQSCITDRDINNERINTR